MTRTEEQILRNLLDDIADAIRKAEGDDSTEDIVANEFADRIRALKTGLKIEIDDITVYDDGNLKTNDVSFTDVEIVDLTGAEIVDPGE